MEAETRESTLTYDIPESGSIVDSQFDTARGKFVSIAEDGTVSLWKALRKSKEWEMQAQWESNHASSQAKVTMQDRNLGSIVAVGDADGRITIWQTRAKYFHPLDRPPPDEQLDLPMQEDIVGDLLGNGTITTMAFSSYQADLRLAVGSSTGLRIFQPSPIKERQWQLESKVMMPASGPCSAIEWLPHSPQLPAMLCAGSASSFQILTYEVKLMKWVSKASIKTKTAVTAIASNTKMCNCWCQLAVAVGDLVEVHGISGSVDNLKVEKQAGIQQEGVVQGIQWHPFGSWLAVSLHTGFLQIWRQTLLGQWTLIKSIDT